MKNTTTRAPRWTFRGFFWKSYEYEIESPTAAEDIAEAVTTATDEELETATRDALQEYHSILADIAALNEQIQEKYRLIRLNNKMDSIIKAEQERRERSASND